MTDTDMNGNNEVDKEKLRELYHQVLLTIGEDPNRDGLRGTPGRVARALDFLTAGYRHDVEEIVNGAIFESDTSELVVVKNIELYSMCEHHLLPFFGKCHVGYLPNGKVIGLSKIARIVDIFARRLQIQENLTRQIAETLSEHTGALGVGVVIEAQHLCMMMRGVEKQNSVMVTSAVLGELHDSPATRAEFFSLIQR